MVRVAGFDLPCGAGHLGLQGAPGALPSALGFESSRELKNNGPPSGEPLFLAAGEGFELWVACSFVFFVVIYNP